MNDNFINIKSNVENVLVLIMYVSALKIDFLEFPQKLQFLQFF